MKRGEVWNVTLPPSTVREQAGTRPAVIIQDETYGQGSPLVLVVPLTTALAAQRFPGAVLISPSAANGLSAPSIAMVFQLRAVDRIRFVSQRGTLEATDLDRILSGLDSLTGQTR